MRNTLPCAALLAVAVAAASGILRADTVTIVADRDNTIWTPLDEELYSNGVGRYLFSGYTLRGVGERRALLRFDVAAAVPMGATVQSVSLQLNCSRNSSGPGPIGLHRMLSNWGEGTSDAGSPGGLGTLAEPGDATWQHAFYPGTDWASPGGDFATSPSATVQFLSVGPLTWNSTPELVADVQAWLANPVANYGWMVLSPPPVGQPSNARRFDSRESPTAANRPRLTIAFSIAPPPCAGDINGDRSVNLTDLSILLAAFGTTLGGPGYNAAADFNNDGAVNLTDLSILLAVFGTSCP